MSEDEGEFDPNVLRQTPLRSSLMEGKRIAGVEDKLVIANGTIAAAMIMGMYWYWWIVIAWLLHRFLKHIYKQDPQARMVYMRYAKQADRYEPWPRINQKSGKRPQGWDRDTLC
ncbi:VirB3 family type IV secretion system protein [Thioalkalivibrio sp. ALE19]|uniref:VirB3 family type IV secretion system protein n=1 Tax=Thioalkalivibrio sp. ALE19 TaxID=1266909 RepID=UPI00048E8638|nr:VirB3 family type IV secretion system protein [Thioalkalivibrio sp. ALE19]